MQTPHHDKLYLTQMRQRLEVGPGLRPGGGPGGSAPWSRGRRPWGG